MTTLNLNLAAPPLLAREAPRAQLAPPALREFLTEALQVLVGGLLPVTPAGPELGAHLRRDLGIR